MTAQGHYRRLLPLVLLLVPAGCFSLDYSLDEVGVPVRADGGHPEGRVTEAFAVKKKTILWCHGLLGRSVPDVAEVVSEQAEGAEGIVSFRAQTKTSLHDWLIAHLSLTLVRMKTVEISGERVLTP